MAGRMEEIGRERERLQAELGKVRAEWADLQKELSQERSFARDRLAAAEAAQTQAAARCTPCCPCLSFAIR